MKRGSEALAPEANASGLDMERLREDFPILKRKVWGKPLVYLDNAATTQKPRAVIEAVRRYYTTSNANVHRGVYDLSERATREYEGARARAARFLNAGDDSEIVFVRGTTEAIRGLGTLASPRTFGHGGVGSSYCWADPDSGVSFAYLTNSRVSDPWHSARLDVISNAVHSAIPAGR